MSCKLFFMSMLCCIVAMSSFAQKAIVDGVEYKVKNGNAVVVGYEKGVTDVVIRSKVTIEGAEYHVTEIDSRAFFGENVFTKARTGIAKSLKSVIIENGVKTIGKEAFYRCQALTSVVLPDGLKEIGAWAFCLTGISEIDIPNSVKKLGYCCFYQCPSLEKVMFPDTPCMIESAFFGCTMISEIRGHDVALPSWLSVAAQKEEGLRNAYAIMKESNPVSNQKMSNSVAVAAQPVQPQPVQQPVAAPKEEVKSDVDLNIPTCVASKDNTFAMIIGNENYESAPTVEFARKDACTFAEYCQKALGLPEENVRLYEDATFGKMRAAVKDLRDIAEAFKGNINIIVYYAGHGIPDGKGNAYLLPVDADGRQTEVCVSIAKLYEELNAMGAKSTVVFMDACFSGAQRGDGMLMAARGVAIKPKAEAVNGNCVVFTAANGEETAYPYKAKGHGLFTYYLLKALQETKGRATLGYLADYLTTNVAQRSIVVNRKSQTPVVLSSPSMTDWKSRLLGE